MDVSLGVLARRRLQLRLQRIVHREEQQREGGIEYNYERGSHAMDQRPVPEPVAQLAAMCGTDATTWTRDRSGLSAFVLEDGVIYHTYSAYARSGRPLGHIPVA